MSPLLKVNSQNIRELVCPNCLKEYKSVKTLKNHKCSYCHMCGCKFSSYQKLQNHKCSKQQEMATSTLQKQGSKNNSSSQEVNYNNDPTTANTAAASILQNDNAVNNIEKDTSELVESSAVVDLVGHFGTMIPDDVICAALTLIKETTGSIYHGHVTPAEMSLYLQNPGEAKPPVPSNELSINIHNIGQHWITSVYDPDIGRILVFDSLLRIEHYHQVTAQLKLLYGRENLSRVDFLPVIQQGTDPACGVFAIANTFTYCLGQHPSQQNYEKQSMRQHLIMCLERKQIVPFPILNSETTQEISHCHLEHTVMDTADKARIRKRKQRSDSLKRARENEARCTDEYPEYDRNRKKIKRSESETRKTENATRNTDEYREYDRQRKKIKRSESEARKTENATRNTDEYREYDRQRKKIIRSDSKTRNTENATRNTDEYRKWNRNLMKCKRSNSMERKKENAAQNTDYHRKSSRNKMKCKRSNSMARKKKKMLLRILITIANRVEIR